MPKPMFDADALITMFESATASQGAQLKKAASDATLASLQGRELTLKNIRAALKAVAEAASAGAAKNLTAGLDPENLLDQAVAGMDDALLKAVEANRTALATLAAQGADLREKHLAKALADLEKMEDTLFATLKKTAAGAGAGAPMAGAWGQVLEKIQAGGTLSGAQANATVEQFTEQVQTAVRSSRAASMRAAQAMAESYTALVSGVLLGMSEALQSAAPAKKAARGK
ncbi:conserved hypothetical protein [Rubrivivax sp. A210]|uniref:DUF6781 family protein n=1 Tax=Rubrivivax sp. A210 TaxID=2772301 RepID=UPI0019195CB7|nr:DUF6781 family protein [Rubrivivax sp. A210]CAD5372432.1 conserved hypothetical protein [Rubrivivax sp. A210]